MSIHTATNGTYASSAKPNEPLFVAGKSFPYVKSGVSETFQYVPLPTGLAGRQVAQAKLVATMEYVASATSRTVTVQRHAKPTSAGMPGLTWNNRPGVLAGSSPVSVAQAPNVQTREFDVTADLQAIANGGLYYGWRITTTHSADSWKVYGFASILPMRLEVTLADTPVTPNGVGPNGITSLAAPVVTWQTPPGLISAQVQVDEENGDFSSVLFDTGVETTTVGEMNLATQGWAGQADNGKVDVRVRQTTVLGTSDWSDPITIERQTKNTLTITAPGTSDPDPTPAVVWTFADQVRWQVVTRDAAGAILHNTGVMPGTDTAYVPPKGATASGQVITHEVRTWDSLSRTVSPGDPDYVSASKATTYTPGAATAVTSTTAAQVGPAPWVDITVARASLPDEWLLIRDGVIILRTPGIVDGNPVWTIRDWTCPPNTDVTYVVRPIVSGAAGAAGATVPCRTKVTGAWLFDPESGAYARCRGTDLAIEEVDSVTWYEPSGATAPTKRTFALRGIEGTIGGKLEDLNGRTLSAQLADWYQMKGTPSRTFRAAYDNVNIPVLVGAMKTAPHTVLTSTKAITKVVSFEIRQNGELPYEPVAL
jgi:hypothetical protein